MKITLAVVFTMMILVGCGGKGDWVQIQLPSGCVVKQVLAEGILSSRAFDLGNSGLAILCEDGRVFH